MSELNIFISSPSDVKNEREVIEDVINNMNNFYDVTDFPKLNIVSLQKNVRSDITNTNAQNVIDSQIKDKYDVFIGILWKRFGTPTDRYNSGTEQEFENAFKIHTQNPNSIKILFYFCNKSPKNLNELDPKQWTMVSDFKNKLQNNKGLYKTYESIDEFKEIITNDLKLLITENIEYEEEPFENDGLIDLIEDFLKQYNNAILIIHKLIKDTEEFSDKIDQLNNNQPDSTNMDIIKRHVNSAANLINEYCDKLNENMLKLLIPLI